MRQAGCKPDHAERDRETAMTVHEMKLRADHVLAAAESRYDQIIEQYEAGHPGVVIDQDLIDIDPVLYRARAEVIHAHQEVMRLIDR